MPLPGSFCKLFPMAAELGWRYRCPTSCIWAYGTTKRLMKKSKKDLFASPESSEVRGQLSLRNAFSYASLLLRRQRSTVHLTAVGFLCLFAFGENVAQYNGDRDGKLVTEEANHEQHRPQPM